MKRKSVTKMALGLLLCSGLAACSTSASSIVGKYSFQLGASNGTNTGMSLTLGDEPCTKDPDNKAFTLAIFNSGKVDISSSSSDSSSDGSSSSDDSSSLNETTPWTEISYDLASGLSGINISFAGSYSLRSSSNQNILDFNVYTIAQGTEIEIPAELVEYVLTSTISGNTVTITIPVSGSDLYKQASWKVNHPDPTDLPDPASDERFHTVSFPLMKE